MLIENRHLMYLIETPSMCLLFVTSCKIPMGDIRGTFPSQLWFSSLQIPQAVFCFEKQWKYRSDWVNNAKRKAQEVWDHEYRDRSFPNFD